MRFRRGLPDHPAWSSKPGESLSRMAEQDATQSDLTTAPAALGRAGRRSRNHLQPLPPTMTNWHTFFAQSLDLLCIARFDNYFKALNPTWTQQLGWTLEELEARPIIDLVHADDRAATRAQVTAIARGQEPRLFENRFRHRDGSYRWLR